MEAVARSLTSPKTDLSTGLQALNDAAAEVEGLSSLRIESQLTSVRPFLEAPCAWAASQTVGSSAEFLRSCFPFSDSRVISDIDTKLRAAAFEIEPDVLKAQGVHGGVILVARDDDSAKAIEKDAQELVSDWKAQLENNEAKMITQAKANPHSLRQRQFAIIVDNFSQALRAMKVTRSSRVVKLQFQKPLDPSDKSDLDDARAQRPPRFERRRGRAECDQGQAAHPRRTAHADRRRALGDVSDSSRPRSEESAADVRLPRCRRERSGKKAGLPPPVVADLRCARRPSSCRPACSASRSSGVQGRSSWKSPAQGTTVARSPIVRVRLDRRVRAGGSAS